MKIILGLLIVLLSLVTVSSYGQINNKELYQRKVESYTKMKKTGFTIAGIGAGATLLGVALVSSADWETTSTSTGTQTTTSDASGGVGLLVLVAAIPAVITGTILGSIGSGKQKYYNEKLERLSVGVNYKPYNKGVVLTYRF